MTPWPMNPMGHDPIVSGGTVTPDPPTPDPPIFLTHARTVVGGTIIGGTITGGEEMASGSMIYNPGVPSSTTVLDGVVVMYDAEAGEAWSEVISGGITTPVAGMGGIALNGAIVEFGAKFFIRDYVSAQSIGHDQGGGLIAVLGPYAKVTDFTVVYGGTMTVAPDAGNVVSGGVIDHTSGSCTFIGSADDVTVITEGGTTHYDHYSN